MNYLQQLMSFVETVPKNPEHISQLKFYKKCSDLESYQTTMLKAVDNNKLQPMMGPHKDYFLIKLHNLEEIRPSQILRLLKRYKAADCSICIYVSMLRLLKRYKAADCTICIYVSAPWDALFLSRHNFVTWEDWYLVLFLKHISMVFSKRFPFIQPGYEQYKKNNVLLEQKDL
jgi:hypothetical protein